MKLLINDDLRQEIVNLIDSAKKSVVLISPYLILNEASKMYCSLQKKGTEGIYIEMHTRTPDKKDEIPVTQKLNNVALSTIYYHNNLHAKAYFNEKIAIITSMNLINKSIQSNIEIGYLTENEDEYKEFIHKFYYKCLIYSDVINLRKKRKYCIHRNLQKIDNNVEIQYINNELIISILGYTIQLYFSEEPAYLTDECPEEHANDTIYTQYFNVSSDNIIKQNNLQSFQMNSLIYERLVPFHISADGSLCIVYYQAYDKFKNVDEILEDNERFSELIPKRVEFVM